MRFGEGTSQAGASRAGDERRVHPAIQYTKVLFDFKATHDGKLKLGRIRNKLNEVAARAPRRRLKEAAKLTACNGKGNAGAEMRKSWMGIVAAVFRI
jgi:hypothetical protein